jgi:hypothetical protein
MPSRRRRKRGDVIDVVDCIAFPKQLLADRFGSG